MRAALRATIAVSKKVCILVGAIVVFFCTWGAKVSARASVAGVGCKCVCKSIRRTHVARMPEFMWPHARFDASIYASSAPEETGGAGGGCRGHVRVLDLATSVQGLKLVNEALSN